MVVPPALVLAVLVWTFLKMDDKITALQKRVDELEEMCIRDRQLTDAMLDSVSGMEGENRMKKRAIICLLYTSLCGSCHPQRHDGHGAGCLCRV